MPRRWPPRTARPATPPTPSFRAIRPPRSPTVSTTPTVRTTRTASARRQPQAGLVGPSTSVGVGAGSSTMGTTRRIANITLDNLDDLPWPCRQCVFWELDPVARQRAEDAGDPGLEKE